MTEIVRCGPEVIDELRPLWLAMVHHHAEVAPQLGPVFGDDESWEKRRKAYATYLAEPGAFVLVVREGARAVGYAVVTVDSGSPTWRAPERFGFVGSLALLPEARGAGAGRALIERAQEEIERVGVTELRLDVVATNDPALHFYERLGFEPYLIGLRRPG